MDAKVVNVEATTQAWVGVLKHIEHLVFVSCGAAIFHERAPHTHMNGLKTAEMWWQGGDDVVTLCLKDFNAHWHEGFRPKGNNIIVNTPKD